jgi:hypothetical protein
MDDELLAGETALIGVMHAGVGEGGLDPVAIHRHRVAGVLLDDREQVPEQALLERGELGVLDRGLVAAAGEAVDAQAIGGQNGGVPVPRALAMGAVIGAAVTAADGSAQAPARWFARFRYLLPSSYT